jgi:hypothetical protein
MDWLNNPWIVGIGGGILSGIFVTIISRYFFSKRDNREYFQKVVSVNREVTYAIKPGISEGIIPSSDVVQSLIKSTARKYGVDIGDVYGVVEIAEDLIKEVMDSSFISANSKADYCNKLNELRQPEHKYLPVESIEKAKETIKATVSDYRERMTTMMSILMGLVSAMMTVVFAFTRFRGELFPSRVEVLIPTLVSVMAVMFTMVLWVTYRQAMLKRERRETKEDENKKVSDVAKHE